MKTPVYKNYEIVAGLISPEDAELMVPPKTSCNACYGRGSILAVDGDGYKTVSKQIPHLGTGVGDVVTYTTVEVREENLRRTSRACHCTFRHARFVLSAAQARARFKK